MVLLNADKWARFSEHLAVALSRVPRQSSLILRGTGNRFAQFIMVGDDLVCEIVSNAYLDEGFFMSSADETTMSENGWMLTELNDNWHQLLGWPARFQEYRAVSDQVVIGLRDILGVHDPDDLATELRVDGEGVDTDPLGLTG